MKVINQSTAKRGEAKIRVDNRNKKIQVIFKDEPDKAYGITWDNAPDYIKPGTFYVGLSNDQTEIVSAHPMVGQYKAKFVKFASKQDEIPTPKSNPGGPRKGKNGSTFVKKPFLSFTPVIEISEGDYAGMQAGAFLEYAFAELEGMVAIKGSGRATQQLAEFMDAVGLMDVDLKWSDNLLPKFQKKILMLDPTFFVTFKGGYIESFIKAQDADEEDEPDEWVEVDEDADDDKPVDPDPKEDEDIEENWTD